MQLKKYQEQALATLRQYFEAATVSGPKSAYEQLTREPELAARLRAYGGQYTQLNELSDTPYVCLRLPTGGGKTILATYAIEVARRAWMGREYPLVLWLTPSNTIRIQTVEALKNPRHPYRIALDEQFGGAVRVLDIGDFTQLLPQDLESKCCVIVGTIQTLRVSNTDGRKVYAHHEMLEPHFSRIAVNAPPGLEPISETDPRPRFSFANLMHVHRPLMIVDEAHNAVTGLSQDVQVRVNPSAIVEFTATPRLRSNTLFNVTAHELKDAEMIKLPVRLAEHRQWQAAVFGAVEQRAQLEEIAKADKDYIRPIVMFQAQNRDQAVTVEVLKAHLTDDLGVELEEIAVVTGDQRDLDGIDLMKPQSPVKFVITVQALKEGWDCPFAYVFCSVANVSSAQDVEQLLGRVLRMPYARRRAQPDLNRAYAHVTSENFAEAAKALKDRLVNLGFTEEEVAEAIEAPPVLDEALFGRQTRPPPQKSIAILVPLSGEELKKIGDVGADLVEVKASARGEAEITFRGVPSAAQVEAIAAALPTAVRKEFEDQASKFVRDNAHLASPAQQGARFTVPALGAEIQGEFELLDPDTYLDFADLSLAQLPAVLAPLEFEIRATADVFEIDVQGNRLTYGQVSADRQRSLVGLELKSLTHEHLVAWLARNLRDPQIGYGELAGWLSQLISHLTGTRGLGLTALNRCVFPLLRAIEFKIGGFKKTQVETVFQRSLFGPEAKPSLSDQAGFKFRHGIFRDVKRYAGDYTFQKHFLGPFEVPAFEGGREGEEFLCAQAVDSSPQVRHWVRNVAQHRDAFWLPLKNRRFYPDFVAELVDGRIAVIEYKGAPYATNDDSREKRAVGEVWQQASKGRVVFMFVERDAEGANMRSQIERSFSKKQ